MKYKRQFVTALPQKRFFSALDVVIKWYYIASMTAISVRFTEKELHKAIVASAKKNRRSINAEILRAIEYYLKNAPEAQKETELIVKTK